MKTKNQSKSKKIGLDLILKPNQLDEQITKPKRLDQMIFPHKIEQIQSANSPTFFLVNREHPYIIYNN